MPTAPASLLSRLERLRGEFGADAAAAKRAAIDALAGCRLDTATKVERLHEALCFVRAYPDDEGVLDTAERALQAFDGRADLRPVRAELMSSGIAGTDTYYRFFWPTACWLIDRWPGRLTIDWDEFENAEQLIDLLPLLATYSESPGIDEAELPAREWLALLKGADETDAEFLIRRIGALGLDDFGKERLYDKLDVPMRLAPGPDTPARSRDRAPGPIVFRRAPLDRRRPDLRREARRPPLGVRVLPPAEGQRLIDLTRAAMVTRARDLDGFAYADRDDARIVECGGGLQFAMFGLRPERRLMLDASYGLLTLHNGMPIGYVLVSALLESAAIAYNVFPTFRGGEAAHVLGRVLAIGRHLFGADTFSIDPYQLGHHNDEGLRSGAWWFYYKLGFRPVDPGVVAVLDGELRRMAKNPRHRSSTATLRKLVADSLYFHLGRPRADVIGRVSLAEVGLAASRLLAARFGADRERGLDACAAEAAKRFGVRSRARWSAHESLWWRRWSPLLLAIDGVERWSSAERSAAVAVVRAKGGRHESEFVPLFDGHRKLRRAVLALARG